MSSGIIQAIDSSPLLRMLGECLMGAPALLARGANAMLDGAVELGSGAMSIAKGTAAMGSSIFNSPGGPEITSASQSISAPAQNHSIYHASEADLCTLSAPTFGCGSRGVGGLGM